MSSLPPSSTTIAKHLRCTLLTRTTNSAIWCVSGEGLFKRRERSWEDFTGQQIEQWLDYGWLNAYDQRDRAIIRSLLAEAAKNEDKEVLTFNARLWSYQHHSYRHVMNRVNAIRDANGHVTQWLGIVTDITELRELTEDELRRALSDLQAIRYEYDNKNDAKRVVTQFTTVTEEEQDKQDVTTVSSLALLLPNQRCHIPPKRKHVLVVDDNVAIRYALERILQDGGYTFISVTNGAEAFEIFQQQQQQQSYHHFDAVLMDVNMPVMDGFEATRKIRELERLEKRSPVWIIGLSANLRVEQHKTMAIECGMNDYLEKPYQREALFAALLRRNTGVP